MTILIAALAIVGLYLTAYVVYHVVLFAANAWIREGQDDTPPPQRRFLVLVPAHDEELHLPRLLASLEEQRYARDQYRVTVIADNCTDSTAKVAHRFDVEVLERADETRRNKGFALAWALERTPTGNYDAVVVVDADSVVGHSFLEELNRQLARGDRVIQCYNGVANPDRSWFTRLMHVSRTINNEIVHPAKRKLGLTSYLMGNGMCFDTAVLRARSWSAFSIGEDWEFYAQLVLDGVDVGYSRGARVYHQESLGLRQASRQRLRWSSGRMQVLRSHGVRLFALGLRTGRFKYIDASLPLLFPNPSMGINVTVLCFLLSALVWLGGGGFSLAAWYGALIAIQFGMFVIGALHTENRAASIASLVVAPVFMAWKMGIDIASLLGVGAKQWTRTEREPS